MKSKILLILFLFGLGVSVSVFLEYRASAETGKCSPRSPCVPDVQPPDCSVSRPLLRVSCKHRWQEHLIANAIRCPQSLCVVFEADKLETVARVSTLDIMRAIGQ